MQVLETALPGILIVEPVRHEDARGFFSESWSRRRMQDAGLDYDWVQDNHSLSMETGTLRGLHFQAPPHAQAKLIRCGRGRLFDAAVDIRRGSPTYGQWVGVELSSANGRQLLVPEGFLHGFVSCEPETEIIYKCSDYYAPDCDGAVRWDSCGIDWPMEDEPIVSDKDRKAPPLSEFESPFCWEPA